MTVAGAIEFDVGELVLYLVVVPLAALAGGFLVGSVNPASIIARVLGKDLSAGSGNPGATNAGRVLGVRWGVVVGAADVLKGLVPVLLWLHLLELRGVSLVAAGLVLGHIWSPWLRGRGGKGVATTLGVVLGMSPWLALVLVAVFGLVWWRTRWVAGGSIAASVVLVLVGVVPLVVRVPSTVLTNAFFEYAMTWVVIGVVVLSRHRANVRGWLAARRVAKGEDGSP